MSQPYGPPWPVIGIAYIHKVPLHPVKVGVWCARSIIVPVFFNEAVNA
jgi:hypothetical protein